MDNLTVLFVDDEPDFVGSLIKRMKKRNINAVGAGSGEEAVALLQSGRMNMDVVVLDVRMNGMDGIETLKAIKSINPLIEVIMLSGHARLSVAREGMELGAFDYLMKPVDLDELLYKLQDAFLKKTLQEKKIERLKAAGESGNDTLHAPDFT